MTYFTSGTYERTISGVASYVDGVQLKIGDRFKPSQRITLPINYLERNMHDNLSRFEYDFELENNVLRKAEERRLQEAQNRVMTKPQITSASDVNTANDRSSPNLPNGTTEVQQVPNGYSQEPDLFVQPRPAMLGMDILTPITFADAGAPKKAMHQKPLIDLADFESSATDPFEMTELKTLNDMEELRSVLEHTLPASSSDTTISNDTESQPLLDERQESRTSNGEGEMALAVEPVQNPVDLSSQFSKPLEINTGEINGGMMTYPTASTNQYTVVQDTPQQYTPNNPVYVYKEESFSRKTPLPPISPKRNSEVYYAEQEAGSESVNLNRTGTELSITSNVSSVSPRAGSSIGVVEVPHSYPKNLNKYACLPPKPASSNTQPEQHTSFTSLSTEKQHFTRSIATMGFPLLRVAKVVNRNGCDTDIVVEALCAIQRLCDKGFDESKVEDVLNLIDNDETKASEFLRLLKQFETLGFNTEDIKKQLIVVGTDEEKILNALTKAS